MVSVEAADQVVLAPHHALGHAGRAAGVQDVQVVGRAAPRRDGATRGRAVAACSYGMAQSGQAPVPSSTQIQVWTAAPARAPARSLGERAVEDDGDGVGVVPQVGELVVGVAVVGVDRHEAGLEHAEHALEVLRAVVQVVRHLVLVRRPPRAAWRRCRRPARRTGARWRPRRPAAGPGRRGSGRRCAPRSRRGSTGSGLVRRSGSGVGRRHVDGIRAHAGGPCAAGRRRRATGSASSIAPHMLSIHHVAPAAAHAAGECSEPTPSMTMSKSRSPASLADRRRPGCSDGHSPPSSLGQQAVPAHRPGHRLGAAERADAPDRHARLLHGARRSSGNRSG